jgi:hypothetical protein
MSDHERERLAQRLQGYQRLLELTTDRLARDAIEQQRTKLAELLDKMAAEKAVGR